MPFELRSPAGLWLLGLIAPLVLLYVLRIRRQRLRVPSTWLWGAAQRDLLAKSPFKRLVVQVPLILQLLALVLLALALARPATRGGAITGDHVAIVIDTSASMSAKGAGDKTRLEQAKSSAHDVIRSLGPGTDAMIVDAGRNALIASPLDRDPRRLDAAVDSLRARDVEGNLGRALAIASDRLRKLPGQKRIIVITDGALAHPDSLKSAGLPVDVIRVGSPIDNVAVVRVDVRSGQDPATHHEQVQAFALLANYGQKKKSLFVTLRQRNVSEPLASRRVTLASGERAPVVLTFEPAPGDAGTGLVMQLSPGDAMSVDDRAFARVPAGRKIPVVMAPKDANPWFKRALLADPDVDLMGTSLAGLAKADVPADALVIIDGACPPSPPGADLVILNPPAGRCRTSVVGRRIDKPAITSWSKSDPRLRFLTLDGVDLLSARRIETDGPADSLVRAREGTVVSDISMPGRSATLVSFDVGDSNWPLKASFVLFVRNIVELARSHRARGITGPARTGQPMRVRVPPDVARVSIEEPGGEHVQIPARAGLVVIPEVAEAGFYFVSWKGAHPGSVLVAANLTSSSESDTRPKKLVAGKSAVTVSSAAKVADARTDWTWLLALLALGFIVFDAWWLTRRARSRANLQGPTQPRLPDRPRAGRSSA